MLDHEAIVPVPEPGLLAPDRHSASLAQRLERGWALMEARERDGLPTDELFRHFQGLLSDYEAACRKESAFGG